MKRLMKHPHPQAVAYPSSLWMPFAYGLQWLDNGETVWRAFRQQGDDAAALEECKRVFSLWRKREVVEALQRGFEQSGYRAAMRAAGEQMVSYWAQRYVPPTDIAMLFAHAEEKDLAIEWLEKGYEERDPRMHMIFIDPDWDLLRSDPRYQDLLRRMNFPG